MAPVDFEKELQDRLRSREVQPREESWDRIEARLEAEIPTRKPDTRKWKYLAAASVVFLLGYFLLQEAAVEVPPADAVVESPEPVQPQLQEVPELSRDSGTSQKDSPEPLVVTGGGSEMPIGQNATATMAVTEEAHVPLSEVELSDRTLADFGTALQDDIKIQDSYWAAADQDSGVQVIDSEVDALLSEAMSGVENRDVSRDTTSLNPATLLGEVESELDQTFREQILKKLKMGFSKVRTAVADRSE